MKKSRKEFIIEAHKNACSEWKQRIESEFPKLFKKQTLEVGKWYKLVDFGKFLFCFNGKYGDNTQYGFNYKGIWQDLMGIHEYDKCILATEEEVKEALIKEAEKRGIWNVPINRADGFINGDSKKFNTEYNNYENKLWSRYGIVFYQGKWATKLENTITREEAEKQLNAKIID